MSLFLPVMSLLRREIVRFIRQRSRVTGALIQPLLFWLLLGSGLRASFRPPGTPEGTNYAEYFYPGIIVLTILFTAIFATIAVIQDRRGGFLQGVLVAPVPRSGIVLGQALGATSLALMEGIILLALAPLAGIPLSLWTVISAIVVMAFMSFGMTGLGLAMAWRMDSVQGFHAIMNMLLMPLWLLSGAFFPGNGVPGWLGWIMKINPLTYGVAALRRCLYWGDASSVQLLPPLALSMFVTIVFSLVMFFLAVAVAKRRPL